MSKHKDTNAENQSNTNPVPCLSVGVSGGIQALDCPIPLHKIEITSLKYIKLWLMCSLYWYINKKHEGIYKMWWNII